MSLIKTLRPVLGDAASFQLMGEDLALVSGPHLRAAADAYDAALAALDPHVRPRFEAEQAAFLLDAHAWLRRHNRSVGGRIAGYLELGRACDFTYPWPVVAILGICQVTGGLQRNRLQGLLAPALARLGAPALARLIDRSDDVLRRTNRGIFADSVPTVLYGLRAHALRESGDPALADALLNGPLPPIFDEHSRDLATRLDRALAIPDPHARFHELAALTLHHFDREQAIFTHHMGAASTDHTTSRGSTLLQRLNASDTVPAPAIVHTPRGRRLIFRPFALPRGFNMRDHHARVEAFGRAFVTSITADPDDYRAATDYVLTTFGAR